MGKVFKNGNSLAVTIPKAYTHQLNIKSGSTIEWKKTPTGILMVNKPKAKKQVGVNAKFAKMVDEFINEHEDVLSELAKR